MAIVEYTESLKRVQGSEAIPMRAKYRLNVVKDEIPYFAGGLDTSPFSLSIGLEYAIRHVLRDFSGVSIQIEGDRVIVANIQIPISITGA